MKTVRKAVLAATVAAALTPAVSQADTTLFGYLDIAVALENSDNTELAVTNSPAGDSIIGVEGEQELDNGNAITYQYIANVDVTGDSGASFLANYHSYIGYKAGSTELRIGNQDLPLRLALDKVDQFAGTYADQNNIIGLASTGAVNANQNFGPGNTTATSSVMLLGGNETIRYAASVDTNGSDNNNASDTDQGDLLRYGAMVDLTLSEGLSFAGAAERIKDVYDAYGISANLGLTDSFEITAGVNYVDNHNGTNLDNTQYVVGAALGLSEALTLKAQHVSAEIDTVSGSNEPNMYAVGADYALSESVTTYVLFAQGDDFGLASTDTTVDGGDASVVAAGFQVSF